MGCGASTAATPSAKYAADAKPEELALKQQQQLAVTAEPKSDEKGAHRFDIFLSHHDEAHDVVGRVQDRLSEAGYSCFLDRNQMTAALTPAVKGAIGDSATLVSFLSPNYFSSTECCLELCSAMELGTKVIFVHVEDSTWGGRKRPEPSDVPEEVELPGGHGKIAPRAAATAALASSTVVEHTRSYFDSFIDTLTQCMGITPAGAAKNAAAAAEAAAMWTAAAGAAGAVEVAWGALRAKLIEACSVATFADAEHLVVESLGLPDGAADDAAASVSESVFVALFGGGAIKPKLEQLAAKGVLRAAASSETGAGVAESKVDDDEESVVHVVVLSEDGTEHEGGVTAITRGTTLAQARTNIMSEADDEDEDDPAAKLLAAGTFLFLRSKGEPGVRVAKADEEGVRAVELGDPMVVVHEDK